MTYPINYPTPQDCDVQIFYGIRKDTFAGRAKSFSWLKPKGASFIWFTLIGAGGAGGNSDGTNQGGGGSGAVTNCLMPAFLVPDQLRIRMDEGNILFVTYQGPQASAGYNLLSANSGNNGSASVNGSGGTASVKTAFASAGLYQSVAGQTGTFGSPISPSATTFLSAGASYGFSAQPNYGYSNVVYNTVGPTSQGGISQISPIIVGGGGASNIATEFGGPGGIGCGGGGAGSNAPPSDSGGFGGPQMAVIISW